MSTEEGGLPSYRGFEYQIDASIWIALDLMLVKERIAGMLVEPSNSEDVEAELAAAPPDSQTTSINVTVTKGRRMLYQMKTRSTGPWTDAAFSSVVGNGLQSKKPARGPTPRARALQLLLEDKNVGYMLITDAGLDSNLFRLNTANLHADSSVTLLSRDLLDKSIQNRNRELAGRVHIMSGLTSELLELRTIKILTDIGKVPHVRVAECLKNLKFALRQRILGKVPAWFEREELLRILRANEGLAEDQEDHTYVAPADLADIEAKLDANGVIVLVGPPGGGKTLLATHIGARLKKGTPPFKVVWEHLSLGNVTHHISTSGPTLIIIGDLWGTSAYAGENTFAHDLFGRISSAPRDKRFIITARSDIYAKVPFHIREKIATNVIEFSEKNYGDDNLWSIVTNTAELTTEQIEILQPWRTEILTRMRLPVALNKFAKLLRRDVSALILQSGPDINTTAQNERFVNTWMYDAEEEIHGTRIRNQLEQWQHDIGEHAVLLWLLSEAEEAIDLRQIRELTTAIRRETAVRLRPEEYVQFLLMNELASISDNHVRIHSLVLEKMSLIVRDRPDLADEFAIAFFAIILRPAEDRRSLGRMERVVGAIRTLYDDMALQDYAWNNLIAEFDQMVIRACLSEDLRVFKRGINVSMWLPWTHSGLVKLLQRLAPGESDTTPPWYGFIPTPEFVAEVRKDDYAEVLLQRFLGEFLPSTNIWYAYEPREFADCIRCFGIPLEDAARAGLQAMERETRKQNSEIGWLWDPDHNAPALLDLLPVSEQLTAGARLGWRPTMSSAGAGPKTPLRTPGGFVVSWSRSGDLVE